MISNASMQRGTLKKDNKVRSEDLNVRISQSIKKLAANSKEEGDAMIQHGQFSRAKNGLRSTRIYQRHVYTLVEAIRRSLSLNSMSHLLTWIFITMPLPKV